MADDHVPTRDTAYFDGDGNQVSTMTDPLIVFFWARLDEREALAQAVKGDSAPGESWWTAAGLSDPDIWRLPAADAALIADGSPQAVLDDVAAKKAILDDYERRCRDTSNPARELECQLIRGVIQQLATVYAGHPDYREDFRPGAPDLDAAARNAVRPLSREEQREVHVAAAEYDEAKRRERRQREEEQRP